jgi:hypothetical protein
MGGNLQQTSEYMSEEVNRWSQIVKAVGAKVE